MAQTGYTPILLYSSSTTTNVPAAGNLTNSTLGSELAINIADGKLFYKDSANSVQVIAWKTTPTAAGGTGLTSYTAGDLIYYASGTTFTKLAIGAANTVLTSSGTAPQWSTNLNIGSLTATSISDSGNITFTGTGNRITGDFSNATFANRVLFQTSTANNSTVVGAIPSGTGTLSGFAAASNSGANPSLMQMYVSDGSAAVLNSNFAGSGTYLPMTFYTGGSERMRIDTSGNVGIGTSSAALRLDVLDSQNANTGGQVSNTNSGTSASVDFRVTNGTNYGGIRTFGASHSAAANQTWVFTAQSNPLIFATNFTERARIDASGFTQFSNNLVMPYQGAPTSKAAAATLSGAELITGILNTTGTTYTITLPTGTNIEGALTWSANNVSLDWWVINTASGTITIGANGNTTLGTLTIATGVSAHFRIRRTAANTFTVYRLS